MPGESLEHGIVFKKNPWIKELLEQKGENLDKMITAHNVFKRDCSQYFLFD